MKKLVLSMVFIAGLLIPVVATAAEFKVPEKGSNSVSLNKGDNAKNLYIAGNTVNVSGDTQGDLVAAGSTLNISGAISQDLFAAGSSVNVSGDVGQNARVAGSEITINNETKGDLLIGGATAYINSDAKIGGDLLAGVGTIVINGIVDGSAHIAGGDTTLSGTIKGDLKIDGGKVTISDGAVIEGKLLVKSPNEPTVSNNATVTGGVDYQKTQSRSYSKTYARRAMGAFGALGVLMALVLLFVIVYVLPKSSHDLVSKSLASFWPNFAWGILAFLVIPSALLILALSVLGLKIAGFLSLLYILYCIVAFTFAILAIGALILKWIEKDKVRVDWLTIIIGLIASIILAFIPFLGGLIVWGFSMVVLGRLIVLTGSYLKAQWK